MPPCIFSTMGKIGRVGTPFSFPTLPTGKKTASDVQIPTGKHSHPPLSRRAKASLLTALLQVPKMMDPLGIATDIKNTLSSAIADLWADLVTVTERLTTAEQSVQHHEGTITDLQQIPIHYNYHLIVMQRHLEDFNSRGHRQNSCVRRISETSGKTS